MTVFISPMASVTRSRRAEGHTTYPMLQTRFSNNNNNNKKLVFSQAISVAPKRRREENQEKTIDLNPIQSPKRQRLTINLSSSPNAAFHPKTVALPPPPPPALSHPPTRSRPSGDTATAAHCSPSTSTSTQNPAGKTPTRVRSRPPLPPQPSSPSILYKTDIPQPPQVTAVSNNIESPKPPARARNAVSRELGSLHVKPSEAKATEGRKLRSQENTRLKSDLSAYFPDYDEVIGNDPRQENLLEPRTPIVIVDDPKVGRDQQDHRQVESFAVRSYSDSLFANLVDTQVFNLDFLQNQLSLDDDHTDPLPDTLFEPVHKRAERAERSVRNTERGRAQHEKEQIIRLLDGLQGHDWLRVMGVSGITETKKKEFEEPRQHFIRGCEAILDKFRLWGVEEKRRKLEKERAVAQAARAETEESVSEEDAENEDVGEEQEEEEGEEAAAEEEDDEGNDEEVPDSEAESDIDASIAKQLSDESQARARSKKPHQRPLDPMESLDLLPPRPFTSFFEKKYQRDAALSKNRRKGRMVLAWGHVVPEMGEVDFELPEEFLDEETLRRNARRKRRDKRGVLRR
ncbi:hypothetical protein MCOR25_008862 [Pyricularia grisea]|uniref:Something about silencing protein 4 domain-containing protein n=1 Tax=Pyricularia grisea TaxID=148305 RepID=A0A6P8BH26_PYRGI|nr:uncharacterized protein PgNI_00247 [Pyricularia grisea]KAI6353859.1 hypothetical protein MCOR25_008862 [Pyricularia grisea]TLD15924.1 hypothetical protein PgNI_00247 [Pyricularia grisea]